jgi:glycosyltransferase involved in cell wall biosynthesis
MRAIRALVVTNLYPSAEQPARGTFIRSQVESLAGCGIEADLLVIDGFRSRIEYLRAVSRLRRALREGRHDLIHAHYGYSAWVALAARSRLRNPPPVVASFLGDDVLGTPREDGRFGARSLLAARLNRLAARRCAAVIVKSDQMAERLGDPRVHVVPNGVDLELFRPLERAECRTRRGLKPGGLHILFAGDPAIPRKRYELARRAVGLFNERVRFRGGPRTQAELHAVYGRPQTELVEWMSACEALLLTSWSEGSPNVVKEAMACNLPVVATAVGDISRLLSICSGNEAIPIPPEPGPADRAEDPARLLAEALARAAVHGRTNCREAMGELSLPAVAARIRCIYEQVLDRPGGGR